MRRQPGVTRWAKHAWRASAVLPGAGPADWRELRREGDAVEFHAATLPLELHRAETESYDHNLRARAPSVWIVMRPVRAEVPLEVVLVTASPYDAQDYCDSGEEVVERVPMPPALHAWVAEFVARHHVEEPFVKRRRDRKDVDLREDGVGDERIAQAADVYRSPASKRSRMAS